MRAVLGMECRAALLSAAIRRAVGCQAKLGYASPVNAQHREGLPGIAPNHTRPSRTFRRGTINLGLQMNAAQSDALPGRARHCLTQH